MRYRCRWCFGCAHRHLTPNLSRVKLLAPVLDRLVPADIEQFLLLWPAIKSNLFAQVVIAWASEPFSMTYLAARLLPKATPAATYRVFLDMCMHIAAQTLPSHTAVAQDISGHGAAEGIGLLSAMVGLGVACSPPSATAGKAVPASPRAALLVPQRLPQVSQNITRHQPAKVPNPPTVWEVHKCSSQQAGARSHQPAARHNSSPSSANLMPLGICRSIQVPGVPPAGSGPGMPSLRP